MPQQFIYRWWESGLGPFEVKGDANSIYRLAMKLELPPRTFRAVILHEDRTPADREELIAARVPTTIEPHFPERLED